MYVFCVDWKFKMAKVFIFIRPSLRWDVLWYTGSCNNSITYVLHEKKKFEISAYQKAVLRQAAMLNFQMEGKSYKMLRSIEVPFLFKPIWFRVKKII
jgi:hypothetical protein